MMDTLAIPPRYFVPPYWQFAQAIKGMGDACRAFDVPVTGGNVSFQKPSRHTFGKRARGILRSGEARKAAQSGAL